MLKSKKLSPKSFLLSGFLYLIVAAFWLLRGDIWTTWDHQVLDKFHQKAIQEGHGPAVSPKIAMIIETNETKDYFSQTMLDRKIYAAVNNSLAQLNPEATIYDFIFRFERDTDANLEFKRSLKALKKVYLPLGLNMKDESEYTPQEEKWNSRQLLPFMGTPIQKGNPAPIFAYPSLMPFQDFIKDAFTVGHINIKSDSDGVFRHYPLLFKLELGYLPALSFSAFLDSVDVSIDELIVDWGREITIPAKPKNKLARDIVIPIDNHGRTYIPFPSFWLDEKNNFKTMPLEHFLGYSEDPDFKESLKGIFTDAFVFICDVSQSGKDIGQTSIEDRVPLVLLHVAFLNGLLTETFYKKWSLGGTLALLFIIAVVFSYSANSKSSRFLYISGILTIIGLIGLTRYQFINFKLFPLVSSVGSVLFIFAGMLFGVIRKIGRDRRLIRMAFSKYLTPTMVDALVERPELLKPGGDEREMTAFFSDLVGFTPVTEKLGPVETSKFMNKYFTEMTEIILNHKGTISQYSGDAIMATFGAPIAFEDHADHAVLSGLETFRRLKKLNKEWQEQGFPELGCRIGINSGIMCFGNLGSEQVYYYSAIGDNVNLAARLESANKQYGTHFMISEYTLGRLTPGKFRSRILDIIQVKGKSNAVKVYEVYGETRETLDSDEVKYYETYDQAFNQYLERNFDLALQKFKEALALKRENGFDKDLASQKMIDRIEKLDLKNLPSDWDGSIALTSK